MDKPRGIKFNQNALNIINVNNKPPQPDQQVVSLKQATLNTNNEIVIDKRKAATTNENFNPFPIDFKLNKDHLEGQKGDAHQSPKEPSPPKLKSNNTKLFKEFSLEPLQPLIQPLISPLVQQQQQQQQFYENKPELSQKRQHEIDQQEECRQETGIKLPENIVSRIPKLSWLPNVASKQLKTSTLSTTTTKSSTRLTIAPKLPTPPTEPEDEEIEDIDKSTSRDAIFFFCDIAKDIYDYMFALEEAQAVKEDYLKGQKILTPKVRQRLINWCIDIHNKLGLITETLYITIALIDRYFDKIQVKQQSTVQLVAIGATLIASKYEEIYPPDIQDLLHLAQGEYSRREVMRVEIQILEELNFDLGKPIPLAFLRRFSKAAHCDVKMHSIAKFLMELSLTEYECSHWRPSMLAAAALFATIYMVNSGNRLDIQQVNGLARRTTPPLSSLSSATTILSSSSSKRRWNKALIHYTHYDKEQLQEPAGILCKILKKALKNPQSFNCVKKVVKSLPSWPELKSARVDELIKLAEHQQLQQQQQHQKQQ